MTTMMWLIGLGLLFAAIVFFYKRNGNGSRMIKQVGRIAVNEITSALNKLEDLEKSLTNSLIEARSKYKTYKENCATIFSLGIKITNEYKEQQAFISALENKIEQQKKSYERLATDELKEEIKFMLSKLNHHIEKRDLLKNQMDAQVEQDKTVTLNLIQFEKKIDELETKVNYVQTQYNIAKNKEMLIKMNNGNCDDGLYNISEIITKVQDYVNLVDGKEKVEEIVSSDDKFDVKLNQSIKYNALEEQFNDLMTSTKTTTVN